MTPRPATLDMVFPSLRVEKICDILFGRYTVMLLSVALVGRLTTLMVGESQPEMPLSGVQYQSQ
jgi:hypothetical protein